MRGKVKEMMHKVLDMLTDNQYQTAKHLAKNTGLSESSIYRMIRLFRFDGIGVISTRKGYVLSKYARKNDDVHFLRVLHGRRASDFVSLKAAEPDLKRRWRGVEQRQNLKQIMLPLNTDLRQIRGGMRLLLKYEKNGSNGKH